MLKTKQDTITNEGLFFLSWIGTTAIAWLPSPINATDNTLRTYSEVLIHLFVYAACGAIIGFIAGRSQTWIFERLSNALFPRWFYATIMGYALALPAGLLISTLVPTLFIHGARWGFLPLSQPSTIVFSPFPGDIFFGGGVLGIVQWFALRDTLPGASRKIAALWVLGTWFSICAGMIVGLYEATYMVRVVGSLPIITLGVDWGRAFEFSLVVQRATIGAAVGGLQGLFILFVGRQLRVCQPASLKGSISS